MGKAHILVVSQYFYPEPFRINDICMEWVKRGYAVTVVTGIPNYPEGRFYQGYGLLQKRQETWNGIRVIRIPLLPRGHTSPGLVLNYLSFVAAGFFWSRFTKVRADYVFTFEVSPMTQALLGVWYARRRKIPNYLYVQDLWPENVALITGIHHPFVLKPIGKLVDYIYKRNDHIFATSNSFVRVICNRGVPEHKVHYWPQYAEEFYRPVEKGLVKEIPLEDAFQIIFTGNIGYAQGLQILPKAAKLLQKMGQQVKFYMVGDGRYKEQLKKEVQALGVEHMFVFIARKPAEMIPDYVAACDAAFLSFQKDPLFAKTIPAKLQSYLACGIPVIASAEGETERIVLDSGCGLVCKIGNVRELAERIKEAAALPAEKLIEMGEKGRAYCNVHFDKRMVMGKMEQYFV